MDTYLQDNADNVPLLVPRPVHIRDADPDVHTDFQGFQTRSGPLQHSCRLPLLRDVSRPLALCRRRLPGAQPAARTVLAGVAVRGAWRLFVAVVAADCAPLLLLHVVAADDAPPTAGSSQRRVSIALRRQR